MLEKDRPVRKARREMHCPPSWVEDSAVFFITVNCQRRGENQLAHEEVSAGLISALEFYQRERRWWVELAVVMPDHVHLLLAFRWDPGDGMMNLVRDWKRYTARKLGIVWQRDYFDHRIRSESDLLSTWHYLRENPVNAGLVESYEQWPYVWRPQHGSGWA